MLVIPAFKACMQSALIRANIKPPVELVVANLEVYSRVSSGSDSFYLYVEDGNGNVNYTTVSKSGTITINDFNGFDPSGKWKIWIVTKGTVSTSTETIKVYYTY